VLPNAARIGLRPLGQDRNRRCGWLVLQCALHVEQRVVCSRRHLEV